MLPAAPWTRHAPLALAAAALALALHAVAIGPALDRPAALSGERPPVASAGLGDLAARLAALEAEVRRLKRQQLVALLEAALARPGPFETELASAIVMAEGDEGLLAELDRLGPLAARGAPTRQELREALPRVVEEARAGVRAPGVIGSATLLMRDLALGLGVGELPEGSVEHLLRQVERARELGRLELAAEQLRALPAGMARWVGPWLEGFAAREAAEQALERLRRIAARGALGHGVT